MIKSCTEVSSKINDQSAEVGWEKIQTLEAEDQHKQKNKTERGRVCRR